jgi:hypothetical protein
MSKIRVIEEVIHDLLRTLVGQEVSVVEINVLVGRITIWKEVTRGEGLARGPATRETTVLFIVVERTILAICVALDPNVVARTNGFLAIRAIRLTVVAQLRSSGGRDRESEY